jgi:hypothetical protein
MRDSEVHVLLVVLDSVSLNIPFYNVPHEPMDSRFRLELYQPSVLNNN